MAYHWSSSFMIAIMVWVPCLRWPAIYTRLVKQLRHAKCHLLELRYISGRRDLAHTYKRIIMIQKLKHTKPPRAPHASTLSGSIKLCLLDITLLHVYVCKLHTFIHPTVMLRTKHNIYTIYRVWWEQDERKLCVYKLNANSELNYPTVYLPCF